MHPTQLDSVVPTATAWFARGFEAIRTFLRSFTIRRRDRSLRICETLPLGEKRFVAVVQFEGRRFLIGSTNQSISLLDRLDAASPPRRKRAPGLENTHLNGVH
jgi:flagellar biogenesis protein FliO